MRPELEVIFMVILSIVLAVVLYAVLATMLPVNPTSPPCHCIPPYPVPDLESFFAHLVYPEAAQAAVAKEVM